MGKIKPYVGAGVNYTVFFDTKGSAAVKQLKAGQCLGRGCASWRGLPPDGQLVRQRRLQEALARHGLQCGQWPSVEGHVDIDPIIVGAGIGYRFGTGYAPLK